MIKNTKILCFYLPQYHPIEENNQWWGPGFTEWQNVVAGRPRFEGHYQPHIPADLGFYDLRLDDTRVQQAALAKQYGIYGFCYYHYWFNGKMLLERPFDEVLRSGRPEVPFCLCWANESWTRAWDGLDREVLINQGYSPEDTVSHFEWLLKAFADPRYIRVGERPLLLIYRVDGIPDTKAMIAVWRRMSQERGFAEPYLCGVKSGFSTISEEDIVKQGFDAVVDFQPNRQDFPAPDTLKNRLYEVARKALPSYLYQSLKLSVTSNKIIDYVAMVEKMVNKEWPASYRRFPVVFPSWDNTARRKSATIIQNENEDTYAQWLKYSIEQVRKYPNEERLVFVNAWNEWAEGCHLEPDQKNGHKFLKATQNALNQFADS